jgi:hypothetical protein
MLLRAPERRLAVIAVQRRLRRHHALSLAIARRDSTRARAANRPAPQRDRTRARLRPRVSINRHPGEVAKVEAAGGGEGSRAGVDGV